MGGHCCGLNSKEENNSQKYHSSQESKLTAESAESVVALTKKKKKKEDEAADKDKEKEKNKKDEKDKKKVSKGGGGGSINKHNGGGGGSKHSKQAAPSSLNHQPAQSRQKSKAQQDGKGGSRSKAASSMAYGREGGGSSSCALPTSSVGGPRTTTAMTAASSSTTGNHQPQHQPSKQLYTSTNKPYRLNSGRPNPLDSVREEQLLTVGLAGRPLGRDQAMKWAKVGGATVNSDFVYQLTTRRTLEKLRRAAGAGADVMTILQEEFAALSPIVPGVYLTGTFGLQKEAFETAKVWVVVNATTELPLLKLPTLLAVRVPVEDDTAHRIDRYFDDVADLMETCRRRGYGSVVHCAAGVSRSAALTLAYLLKYTDLSLLEAFRHTRTVRPVVRPNTGFMVWNYL